MSEKRHQSCREAEIDDVAVLHDVLLALEAHFTVVAARRHRPARNERVIGDDFRADETTGNVAVDFPGGKLRLRLARNRPGPALILADREKRNISEQIV